MTFSPADKDPILAELDALARLSHVDTITLSRIRKYVESNDFLYRDAGAPEHHLCAFFVPVVPGRRLIYMGHHKKADDWIPNTPGYLVSSTYGRDGSLYLSEVRVL